MRTVVGAFLRRDAQVALSYRLPFVVESLGALFVLVTFSLLGRLVERGSVPGGFFSFVAIGLALTAFLEAGMSVVAGNFRQEQVQGTLENLLSSGLPPVHLAAGMAAYPMAWAFVRVAILTVIAAALGAKAPGQNWGLATAAVSVGAVSFAGLGLIAAALVLAIRQAGGAVGFLVSLIGLAGGWLFPPELLPAWSRSLANLSPFTHALRLTREALLEGASWASGSGRLLTLAVLSAVYAAIGVAALSLALTWSRRRGSIAQY